jgi:catechol 2,3-dioxygenase-like lactoylglutathione lyase family enzyme
MLDHITHSGVYVLDQDEALDFYVGKLGLEKTADVDLGFMRWLTVSVPGENRQLLLEVPGPPAHDDATAAQVRELVTKGATGLAAIFTTEDARATFAELRDRGVDLVDEPTERPPGIDFGVRDPFGNRIRITQPVEVSNEEIQKAYDAERAVENA